MSHRTRQVVLSAELDARVHELGKELGLNTSSTIRLLIQRGLGNKGIARLLVDEKIVETKRLIAVNMSRAVEGLRQELHAVVDQVAPPAPTVEESEEEAVEVAPVLTGRKRRRR